MLATAILFLTVRAPYEERFLASHFGDSYRAYVARTGRVLPLARSQAAKGGWPPIPGKYFVANPAAPVAVTTLGSAGLAQAVAKSAPRGLCIAGKLETENIGIEKIVKNVVANPAIRFLVCAGIDVPKHLSGATILALCANGTDASGRIAGSPGRRPVLRNTTAEEVRAFRDQIEPIDMIGCTDVAAIGARVRELAARALEAVTPSAGAGAPAARTAPRIAASAPPPERIKLDQAGYFVIDAQSDAIFVEHYDYQERLLRSVEGADARAIYWTLIGNGWVTKLDHAAYLGKELARAESCMKSGVEFVQDGA
jgi:tetrahydromethanopterin S-methyltransferase subunit A